MVIPLTLIGDLATHAGINDTRPNLLGQSRDELADLLRQLNAPAFRLKQLWHWLYAQGVGDFTAMTSLGKDLREQLNDKYIIERLRTNTLQESTDGTRKWLIGLRDGNEVEAVHIPEGDRGTLCISSQVGCTLNCRFCHTGTQLLVRNLTPAEIVGQVMLARDFFKEWPTREHNRAVTNIVLMGMGEPLYNFENVAQALKIIMDPEGLSISRRKITLSTAGVVPNIHRCGQELGVRLAVSLHAVTNEIRDRLVPLNIKYPIEELLQACRTYPGVSNAFRITFEYVMLDGVNDSDADAKLLVKLLAGIPAKINLIPFNPWPGAPFACSKPERIKRFSEIVQAGGYPSPVRTSRGQDILAACGQLKSTSQRPRKSDRYKTIPLKELPNSVAETTVT